MLVELMRLATQTHEKLPPPVEESEDEEDDGRVKSRAESREREKPRVDKMKNARLAEVINAREQKIKQSLLQLTKLHKILREDLKERTDFMGLPGFPSCS